MTCNDSRYAHDKRVTASPIGAYIVDFHGVDYLVHNISDRGWSAEADVDGATKVIVGYDTADDAIAFLIGPPAGVEASA